jgi:hypothetical protein
MTISPANPSTLLAQGYQGKSDHTSPTLWVDSTDGLPVERLAQHFQLLTPTPNDKLEPGHHIIALRGERAIRKQIKAVQGLTDEIAIFPAELLPFELPVYIGLKALPLERWLKAIKDEPLELEAALDIARDTLASFQAGETSSKQKNIELEELRQRCRMTSSFDWNRFIQDLEQEIHATVDRRGKSERIKLEIQAWLRITDPFEQEVERIRILTHYQLRDKSFERMAQAMRLAENESANKCQPVSIGELFGLESEPLRWLAPGFMPAKTSGLLSGLPGSGKSLLALDLAYAVCRGEKFLGEQCAKGKVLYLASDQPLNQTKQYVWERGFEDSDPLTIVGEGQGMSAWSVRKLEDLESWLLMGGFNLVIVDSIRSSICYPLGLEEKSEHIGHWMKEVERLVIGHGASLLWIHHDNKDKDLKGVSRSSGSTAIPANVSVHLRVENASGEETSPMRRLTMPKTRNFEAQSLEIQFSPETYEWELIGRTGESPEVERDNQTLGEKIQALLHKHPGVGLEVFEIKQAVGDSPSVYKVLSRLEARGILGKRRSAKNSKAKVYYIASSDTSPLTEGGGGADKEELADPPPPRLCPSAVRSTSESKTQKEIPSSDTHLTPPPISAQVSDEIGKSDKSSDTQSTPPAVIESVEEPISPNERSQISRCLGAITGVLWQDDFSAGVKKKKLSALREEFGSTIYNAACQDLSDEDKADLEALRRQRSGRR